MKIIYLVRHGKAVARGGDLPDFKRSLIKKGEKESEKIALNLKKKGIKPDLFISSPANRALETAKIFANIFNYPIKNILLNKTFYDEIDVDIFLTAVKNLNNQYHSVMIFGHEPTISEFATMLVPSFSSGMAKSGVVGINFKTNSWKQLKAGSGSLYLIKYPGRKDKTNTLYMQFLQKKLEDKLHHFFEEIHPDLSKKMKKYLKKASIDLIKKYSMDSVKKS